MDTNQSGQIFHLIPKIMREVGAIEKGRRNPQQGYAFRGIDDIYNAIQSHFAANGVFCAPEVVEQLREDRETKNGSRLIYTVLRVKHTFYAADGSSFAAVTVGEAMDSGDKSANKAMSAAMKYALIEVFAIPTEGDNDTENQTHELSRAGKPQPQAGKPAPQPKATRLDDAEFVKALEALDKAWQSRNVDVEEADRAIGRVLQQQKIGQLREASRTFFRTLITDIKAGKYDPQVPAGAAN